MDFASINKTALFNLEDLVREVDPGARLAGSEWGYLDPRDSKNPSRSESRINSESGKWGAFWCGGSGGDVVSWWADLHALSQGDAARALADRFNVDQDHVTTQINRHFSPLPDEAMRTLHVAINDLYRDHKSHWIYRDAIGRPLFVRVLVPASTNGKKVMPLSWHDVQKKWIRKNVEDWPVFFGLETMNQHANDAPVFLVEGEKTTLAARVIFPGHVVLGLPGTSTAASIDVGPLRGRVVTLIPDADTEGVRAMTTLAERLPKEGVHDVRMVDLPQLCFDWIKPGKIQPGGWDLADPAPNGVDVHSMLAGAKEYAAPVPAWPEPQSLTSKIESKPYPMDAMPETLRNAVEEVQRFVQAPVSLVASSALAALSLTIQAHVDVERDELLFAPASLFLLTIAASGERKTQADKMFVQVIQDYQDAQAEASKPVLKSFTANLDAWESKRRGINDAIRIAAKGGEDTKPFEVRLQDLEYDKPEAPRIPKLIREDATPEGLAKKLQKEWPSAGVISNEAGIIFGSHGMGKESIMRNLALLNKLWDGGRYQSDRGDEERSRDVHGARLTMGLMIQETTLRAFFEDSKGLARGTGFLARFLLSWPDSTMGTRFYTPPASGSPALSAFNLRISSILNRIAPINANGSLTPAKLTLSIDAKTEWIAFHNEIERELGSGGKFYDVRDVASKTADNAARLAALFHVFEGAEGGLIGGSSFVAASRIAAWHLHEARRFFGELALPIGLADAARLEAWLIAACERRGRGENRIPTKDVLQCGPTSLRNKASVDVAMEVLEELDRARRFHEGKRKFIEINPSLLRHTESATANLANPATGETNQKMEQ